MTLIAVLDFVVGGLKFLAAFALLAWAGRSGGTPASVLGMLALLAGAVAVIAGIGLMRLRAWGRILQLVLAWIGLLGFPIGTIFGILILVYLYRPGVRILFAGRSADGLADEEIVALRRVAESSVLPAVVIFVVVLFGGIFFMGMLAAIAIPNLLNAIDRGKQKRTMADIRSISAAVESYAIDHDFYPTAPDLGSLRSELEPTYIRNMPSSDGWGHDLIWESFDGEGYRIRSTAKDGLPDEGGGGYEADIVLEDGEFVQRPE